MAEIDSNLTEAKQYIFGDGIETIFKITSNDGCSYYFGKLIEIIFLLMGLYQLVFDVIYFVKYTKKDYTGWQNYECYSYIVTNSANMKQFIVFGLCRIINGEIGIPLMIILYLYGSFWTMGAIYCLLMDGFGQWVLFLVHVFFFGIGTNWTQFISAMFLGLWCYFGLILYPVGCMSKLYNGGNYIICTIFNI